MSNLNELIENEYDFEPQSIPSVKTLARNEPAKIQLYSVEVSTFSGTYKLNLDGSDAASLEAAVQAGDDLNTPEVMSVLSRYGVRGLDEITSISVSKQESTQAGGFAVTMENTSSSKQVVVNETKRAELRKNPVVVVLTVCLVCLIVGGVLVSMLTKFLPKEIGDLIERFKFKIGSVLKGGNLTMLTYIHKGEEVVTTLKSKLLGEDLLNIFNKGSLNGAEVNIFKARVKKALQIKFREHSDWFTVANVNRDPYSQRLVLVNAKSGELYFYQTGLTNGYHQTLFS